MVNYRTVDVLGVLLRLPTLFCIQFTLLGTSENCRRCDDRQGSFLLFSGLVVWRPTCTIEAWICGSVDVLENSGLSLSYFDFQCTAGRWWWIKNFVNWWKWIWWTFSVLSSPEFNKNDAGLSSYESRWCLAQKILFSTNFRVDVFQEHWWCLETPSKW